MGELQKRMKCYHDNDTQLLEEVLKKPQIPLNQYHHGYVKGFNEAEKIIFKIVDEMTKDFHTATIYLPRGTTEEKLENLLNERKLRKEWFVRWLMPSAEQSKGEEK